MSAPHWEVSILIGPCDQDDAEWLAGIVGDAVGGHLGAVVAVERIDDLDAWSGGSPRNETKQ